MLAGWLDLGISADHAVAVQRAMRSRALPKAAETAPMALQDGSGLFAAGSAREADLWAENGLSAALFGQPRWTDAGLAEIAVRDGHAKALAEAYRRYGEGLLEHLKGSFAIAIITRAPDKILLAIDRLGIQRLCISETPQGLVFGTSADAVRAHPSVTSTIAPQAIFDFLYFGISPAPGTIYREQIKLLPGQLLVFERGRSAIRFYWQMPYGATKTAPPLGATEQTSTALMGHLREAVHRNVAGEDPATLGAFLSGGLDSSTVAGLLSQEMQASGRKPKTFTIGFAQAKYDETGYAEIASRHFKTEQHNYSLGADDVVAFITKLAEASDEPFGNSSVVPSYYCAKMAREFGVEKILAGDGGDEVFGGNSRYVEQQMLDLYSCAPAVLRRGLIEPALLGLPGMDRLPLVRSAANYVRRARVPMPERMESFNFYRNADLAAIFTSDMLAAIDVEQPLAGLREAYHRGSGASTLQRMLHLDLKITLADNDLRKVQIACDMAGIRVAYPFLDDDLVEFSAGLPPNLLIKNFHRRWLFKQAVKDFLPPETLAKRKHGFGMPFTEWPREHPALRQMAVDCLESFKTRGYLRSDFLERIIDSQSGEYDGLVWDILMLELWLRVRDP